MMFPTKVSIPTSTATRTIAEMKTFVFQFHTKKDPVTSLFLFECEDDFKRPMIEKLFNHMSDTNPDDIVVTGFFRCVDPLSMDDC